MIAGQAPTSQELLGDNRTWVEANWPTDNLARAPTRDPSSGMGKPTAHLPSSGSLAIPLPGFLGTSQYTTRSRIRDVAFEDMFNRS
ncbi:hypothetical protein RhiXN_05604 [Rhizoctonia solani]|uniref:Uncharacterized protein n=1 Tax=Rhizoctonia solani TaxID=456999 RepID=A0A8H8NWD3_9AGAM|nr:uncharacterized protein RhiXN_05604 [Rhizoctonia solani]QRW20615.1 hypothetical protein RhiXN_05604 [Rhizoctonia solani]